MDNSVAVENLDRIFAERIGKHPQSDLFVNDILAAIQADPEAFGVADKRIAELEAVLGRTLANLPHIPVNKYYHEEVLRSNVVNAKIASDIVRALKTKGGDA